LHNNVKKRNYIEVHTLSNLCVKLIAIFYSEFLISILNIFIIKAQFNLKFYKYKYSSITNN